LRNDLNDENKKRQSESLASYAYNKIRNKIVDGELAPGNVLSDQALAEELGVSRTPVREALKKLSDEGWVLWTERKGITVSKVNEDDEYQLLLLRKMIDPYVVKMAITTKRPQVLAGKLVACVDEMERVKNNPVEFIKADMSFHTEIIKYLGLTKLLPLWDNICDDMTRLVVQSIHFRRPADDIIEEHRLLVEAFWHSDLKTAIVYVNKHLQFYNASPTSKDVISEEDA